MSGRDALGLAGLDLLFLAAGLSLLCGVGLVRSWRSAVRYGGLALFAGWAAVGVVASLLAVAGASLATWQIVLTGAGVAACSLALTPRVRSAALASRRAERGAALSITAGATGLLLLYLIQTLRGSIVEVTTAWDAQTFWVPKAAAIVYQGGIHAGDGRFTSFANPDYPLFSPVQDAISFRFMGRVDPAGLPGQHWVIALAFLWAIAGLLVARVRPLLLAPGLALLVLMPSFGNLIGSSLGDEPLALLVALAGLIGALWLLERDPRLLVVCGVLTTAAAVTKVEGLPAALILPVLLAAATRLRAWRPLLVLAIVPVLADVPWRLWMRAHHVPNNSAFPYSKLLDPGFLAGRIDRLGTALDEVPGYLFSLDAWLLAVPVALGLAALLVRRRPALSVLVLGTVGLAFLGNVAIYWISPLPIHWYIDTSAARVVSSSALFCATLAPLLLSEALAGAPLPALDLGASEVDPAAAVAVAAPRAR
jgi:hypothetical protein